MRDEPVTSPTVHLRSLWRLGGSQSQERRKLRRLSIFAGANRAKEVALQHVKDRRAIRRVQWIKERVGEYIGKANGEFADVCAQLYRNPKAAWSEINRCIKAGERIEDIDLNTVGKKKGWKFLGYRSKGRKNANEVAKSLPRAHRKLERLRNQWAVNQQSELELHAKLGASEAEYNDAMAVVGEREERRARGLELWRERHKAVSELTERDIWQCDLLEEEKEKLARTWEEASDLEARREGRALQNEVVRDFYETLLERSQEEAEDQER